MPASAKHDKGDEMAAKTKENPYGIDPARDLHHSPPRIDGPWSENLLFTGVDAKNGIFYYHHLGLVDGAPDVWRGDFAAALPDGRQLLQVTFGNSSSANSIGDGTLECECIEPLRSWRVRFKGAAYLTDAETNRSNYLSVEQIRSPASGISAGRPPRRCTRRPRTTHCRRALTCATSRPVSIGAACASATRSSRWTATATATTPSGRATTPSSPATPGPGGRSRPARCSAR